MVAHTKDTKRIVKCKRCGHSFEVADKSKWHKKKLPCPKCKECYCVFPVTESKLWTLQDQFLVEKDYPKSDRILSQMYLILIPYAESLIKKHFRRFLLPGNDSLQDVAYISVCNMVSDFLGQREGKKNYRIRVSFGGQLKLEIVDTLFGPKSKGNGIYKELQKIPIKGLNESNFDSSTVRKLTSEILSPEWKPEIPRKFNPNSYNIETDEYTIRFFKEIEAMSLDYEVEENKTLQLADKANDIERATDSLQSSYLEKFMFDLVDQMSGYVDDEYQDLKRLIALNIMFERGEHYVDKFFSSQQTGLSGKYWYMKTIEIVKKELKDEAVK